MQDVSNKIKNHINSKKLLRVSFLTQGDRQLASSRFRVYQFLDIVEKECFQSHILPLPPPEIKMRLMYLLSAFFASAKYDVTFVQKILFPKPYLLALRRVSGRLIYDWDDALYTLPPRQIIDPKKQFKRVERLHLILRLADTVICGNEVLAEYSAKYCADIRVIPTSIKINQQLSSSCRDSEVVTIGWIGRAENLEYLERLEDVFDSLHDKYGTKVRLLVVCDKPLKSSTRLTIINKKWQLNDEETDITSFDIGIMPLEDTAWARGKCAFKLLQYMAFGVVCVGSPVGANKQVVKDAENGLLATTYKEWLNALSRLIEDPTYRYKLAASARSTVEKIYSVSANKKAFVGAVLGDI